MFKSASTESYVRNILPAQKKLTRTLSICQDLIFLRLELFGEQTKKRISKKSYLCEVSSFKYNRIKFYIEGGPRCHGEVAPL